MKCGTRPDYLTAVGEFENSDSAYGTFDQGGNVWEWNETLIGSGRGVRGGSCYYNYSVSALASSYRYGLVDPAYGDEGLGFRVASIPEPATMVLLGLGGIFLRGRKF